MCLSLCVMRTGVSLNHQTNLDSSGSKLLFEPFLTHRLRVKCVFSVMVSRGVTRVPLPPLTQLKASQDVSPILRLDLRFRLRFLISLSPTAVCASRCLTRSLRLRSNCFIHKGDFYCFMSSDHSENMGKEQK